MEKKIVMFIDDDTAFLGFAKQVCRKVEEVFQALFSADGDEALKTLEELSDFSEKIPNIIFLDVNMPGMDGFEFLKKFSIMKEHRKNLNKIRPIAMLSSSDQQRDKDKAIQLGADSYFVKPGNLNDLRKIISEILQ